MTQDEIIKLAMDIDGHINDHAKGIDLTWDTLVEIVRTAIKDEREACAKVCEARYNSPDFNDEAIECADAIRARGE